MGISDFFQRLQRMSNFLSERNQYDFYNDEYSGKEKLKNNSLSNFKTLIELF